MKRILVVLVALVAVAVSFLVLTLSHESQRADYGWRPAAVTPSFVTAHPRVLIDEGHHNASTAGITGRYWPFARLLRAAGYEVLRRREPLSAALLHDMDVLVIANASGAAKPQIFGVNIPGGARGDRGDPAFTPREIEVVRRWVEAGGSLLLIADHAPFGRAASGLAAAFGVTMRGGFVELKGESSDPLLFSRENGRIGFHPITDGDGPATAVNRVQTFTGQSLDGPPGAFDLLKLPETAVEFVPSPADSFVETMAGRAQGVALELGAGRVVVLGEAAMLTAQTCKGEQFGMDTRKNDNERFVRNVMVWLAGPTVIGPDTGRF